MPTPTTAPLLIHLIQFEASCPYAVGHSCSEAEAAILNAARHDNIRSNFGKKVKAQLDLVLRQDGRTGLNATEVLELRHLFAQYDATYTVSPPLPRRALDPVGRAAYHIAQELVAAKLRERGLQKSDLPEGQFEQHVAVVAARPAIRAEAERRVAATAGIVAEALDFADEQHATGIIGG